MNRIVHIRFAQLGSLLLALLICVSAAQAQTTSFTYQGRFTDNQNGGNATNGTYDFQFRLFDALNGGNQVGGAVDRNGVTVTNSAFTVQLDFGAAAFPGANRFLEISARQAGGGSLSTLNPRQPVTSTPYAIKSLSAATADTATTANNAQQLGGQTASQFVLTGDARLSDARTPTAGSGNYIQNTTAQQANSNFFISQVGTAGQDLNAGREITVDFGGTFNGNFNSFGGLRFGNTGFQTGEGLASKRTAGGNQFGLDFYTGYVSRLAITNSGNVGIGTSAPTGPLHVVTNQNSPLFAPIISGGVDNVLLSLANTGTGGRKWSLDSTGGTSGFGQGNLAIWNGADFPGTPTMLLQPNGNVGIGTNTPGSLLTLRASSATAPALEVNQGAIKVMGAGVGTTTPVFVHRVTSASRFCPNLGCSFIDHPLSSGDPNAILIVTQNLNPGGGTQTASFVPWFIFYNNVHWCIATADGSALPVGAAFNVMIVKP